MDKRDYMFVRFKGSTFIKIKYAEITHVVALRDYCSIFTNSRTYTIHSTLTKMAEMLPVDKFYRCGRSHIINIDEIEVVDRYYLYMNDKNKSSIAIGGGYRDELLKKLNYISFD